jgi:plastocyanin
LVLAGTNYERLSITGRIREGLKAEGSLGKSTNVTQLKAKDLTSVQMKYVHNFEIGDMVMPIKSYKKRGLEKRRLYQVVSKTLDTLTLRDENGMTYRVDPNFEKAVFSPSEIEIASGDRLRWTHNDRDARRRNGQEFKIIKLDKASATIEYADGTQENLDLTLPLHLDYALVSTTYSSQGKTANRVLIAADHTVASESFYVAVSRVKDELKLYTTDKDEILDKACVSKAKENPLEVLQNALATEAKSLRSTQKSAQPPTPTTDENDSYYNQARIHNNSEIDEQITRSHYEQKLPDFLARQQQLDRLAYENLARRIKQLPEFKKASPEAVDTAIAKAILSQSNDFEEVGRILTQCDLAQQWRKDLSTEQDIARLSQYIEEVCAEATKQLETIHYRTKELER